MNNYALKNVVVDVIINFLHYTALVAAIYNFICVTPDDPRYGFVCGMIMIFEAAMTKVALKLLHKLSEIDEEEEEEPV